MKNETTQLKFPVLKMFWKIYAKCMAMEMYGNGKMKSL